MLSQELLGDPTSIRHNTHGFQLEFALAEIQHGAKEGRVEEGLPAGEIDLAHSSFFEEQEAAFRVGKVAFVGCGCGVETKTAAVVALAGEVVVDGDGTGRWFAARARS